MARARAERHPDGTFGSVEIPAFHLDGIDVAVRNIDVAGAQPLGRQLTRIEAAAGVGHLIAAAMRQWKGVLPIADGGELGRQIGELVRD